MKNVFFILLVVFVAACNNNKERADSTGRHTDSKAVPGSNLPDFNATDSLEVYFYKDPAKPKEFTRLFVADPSGIALILRNLDNAGTTIKECPHDGKIFFYRNGEVFKTVYIATADTCRYLAYAINANPKFVRINDSVFRLISKLKATAR